MSELTNEQLRTLSMQALAELLPACVWIDDCAAVITRVKDAELVEVFIAGQITALDPRLLYVQPLTDPAHAQEVLREAAALLARWHQSVDDQNDQLVRDHNTKLGGIRHFAVRLHENDEICRAGLDRFLAQFQLRPYCGRARVSYTICGHYDLENTDENEAFIMARDHLRPDLTGLGAAALSPRHELVVTITDRD